jgi:hypothetical protein
MDDLDRLFQRLVHNIRFRSPEYLTVPFTVQDLYDALVPYRHNRRELGIETNQDYETAVARLLSGERGYVRTDPELQDKLKKELASINPDPGIFRDAAGTRVSLEPSAIGKVGGTEREQVSPAATTNAGAEAPMSAPAIAPAQSTAIPAMENVDVPQGCRYCGATLPEGRKVTFCPQCGMNLSTRRCDGCGTELEGAWRFCVNCGKKVA